MTTRREDSSNQPMDAAGMICARLLAPWIAQHGPLPAPCPYTPQDCATWWLNVMQEPRKTGEYDYAQSRMAALAVFLRLTPGQRNAIVACVTDDHVPYRGDPFPQYVEIFEETLKMRENPAAYKLNAIARAKMALEKFGRPSA